MEEINKFRLQSQGGRQIRQILFINTHVNHACKTSPNQEYRDVTLFQASVKNDSQILKTFSDEGNHKLKSRT